MLEVYNLSLQHNCNAHKAIHNKLCFSLYSVNQSLANKMGLFVLSENTNLGSGHNKGLFTQNLKLYIANQFHRSYFKYSFFAHKHWNTKRGTPTGVKISSSVKIWKIYENKCFLHKCSNGMFISAVSLCDKTDDCGHHDASDENKCQQSKTITKTCPVNLFMNKFGQCQSIVTPTGSVVLKKTSQSTLKQLSCLDSISSFFFYQICIFKKDSTGMLAICSNGMHLRNCALFQCSGLLKCPSSYCISYSALCNGMWDCPDGFDEENCQKFNCSLSMKCRNFQMCINLISTCDGHRDCPLGDDEFLCDLQACPDKSCTCLNYAVSCFGFKAANFLLKMLKVFHLFT